jgi:hypothetical protein
MDKPDDWMSSGHILSNGPAKVWQQDSELLDGNEFYTMISRVPQFMRRASS